MEPPTYPGLELLDFRYVTWARRTVLQHWYRIKTIDKYLFLEDISGEDASKDHIDLDVFVIGTVLNSFEDETKHTTADVTSCPCRESVNLFMTYGPPEFKSDHWPWPLAEKHWVEAYRSRWEYSGPDVQLLDLMATVFQMIKTEFRSYDDMRAKIKSAPPMWYLKSFCGDLAKYPAHGDGKRRQEVNEMLLGVDLAPMKPCFYCEDLLAWEKGLWGEHDLHPLV